MITWKSSFNRLNEEYGIAKKKKEALDGLFEKGRISKSTHDSFKDEIVSAIAEIEKQQQELGQRMQQKTQELENQIKTLEILLANYEIQYVAGEIDDNTYQLEINLLGSGLDLAKRELNSVTDAVNQLCAPSLSSKIEITAPI
ncbi:MAG: CdvA-like protein, partial [Crenarchaeota archaeon]|nr:CdvA-like protein [Thermoproteota archaeon]